MNHYELTLFDNDLAEVLRRVAYGKTIPTVIGRTWDEVQAGNVTFEIEGWTIVIFNDGDSLDYIDEVTAPDGRHADFDDWSNNPKLGCDPLRRYGSMGPRESADLLNALKAATASVASTSP